jgi:hypothetical protein
MNEAKSRRLRPSQPDPVCTCAQRFHHEHEGRDRCGRATFGGKCGFCRSGHPQKHVAQTLSAESDYLFRQEARKIYFVR